MAKERKYDIIDAGLEKLFLHEHDEEKLQKEFETIMASDYGIKPNEENKQQVIAQLSQYAQTKSFGRLLSEFSRSEEVESVAEKVGLPKATIEMLYQDQIMVNRIPILRLKLLLEQLDIPFREAKKAIQKTLEYLKKQTESPADESFNVAFKKRDTQKQSRHWEKDFKSTLYENEEAVQKYLSKLEELMNK